MKVSSLFFVGFLGAVSAVAAESEAGAEDYLLPEYGDTEYWRLASNADGEEYTVPFEYGPPPDYGEFKSYADDELDPRNNSGWFMPDVDGSFYWMSKEEMDIVRQAIIQPLANPGSAGGNGTDGVPDPAAVPDLTTYILYNYSGNTVTSEIHRYDDQITLSESNFNPKIGTVFLIYDWDMNCNSEFVITIRTVLFKGEYNIFCVGWSYYAANRYVTVVGFVEVVGKYVARFIDFVRERKSMKLEDLTLIGYGLGAHVAGHAGKNVEKGKIDVIIGLDPAGPGFNISECDKRLCSTDANYVQSIQTNGGDYRQLGFNEPLGVSTFYPDGGIYQTPCFGLGGFDCSHSFSYKYYAIALEKDNFCAVNCTSYQEAQERKCGRAYSYVNMGFPKIYQSPGVYYVPIARVFPYDQCSELAMN